MQQNYILKNQKLSVEDRIVGIEQPYVRPIVRGKAKAKMEFDAKVEISVVDGFVRIEKLSWDAYNECESLQTVVEAYRQKYGCYPQRILFDKIYRNRKNLGYCKDNNISALGRPKQSVTTDKRQEYVDICDRNIVEGKFDEGKLAYELNRIASRLRETSEFVISIGFLAMNLNKKLRDMLSHFLKNSRRVFQW
ncbi:transposase [Clostridium cellulovorans]|uniref:transposase n=1 Tax=Clostridium cellulovorans TaxID=1493 RepID=UPI0001A96606|nr:transposase [Clostridium cellulovorans]